MTDPLEHIFGSKTRLRILKAFILNPKIEFSVKEIGERIKCSSHSVSQELKKLIEAGMIKNRLRKGRYYYFMDRSFVFYPEFKKIVAKCNITPGSRTLKGIKSSGKVVYAVLSGIFTENRKTQTDLLVVGESINQNMIKRVVAEIEADIGREIRYSILSTEELFYRMEMFDKFIVDVMKEPNIILVDKVKETRKRMRSKKKCLRN